MKIAASFESARSGRTLRWAAPRSPSAAAFLLALCALCAIGDGIPVLLAEGGLSALSVVVMDVVLGTALAAVVAGVLAVLQRLRSRLPAWTVAGLGLALTGGACAFIISPVGRSAEEAYWATTIACSAVLWGAGYVALRLTPRALAVALALAIGSGAMALDLWVERTLYTEFHVWFEWCAVTCFTLASSELSVLQLPRVTRPARLVCALFLGLAVWVAQSSHPLGRAGWLHGRWLPSLSSTARALADVDGDGFSPWLWGGDCDDGDPRVYPGAPDPSDGVDRNCNGIVDVPDGALARGLNIPLGEPAFAHQEIERVVLVTLDTFRPEVFRHDVMPNTAKFFDVGARFERTYANATSTALSLPYFVHADASAPHLRELLKRAGIASIDEHQSVTRFLGALAASGSKRVFAWIHLDGMHAGYVLWPGFETPPEIPPLPRAYVSEAAHLDAELAPLWTWLAAPEHAKNTLVLLSSDHGEGAGEHGIVGHTRAAWEEIVRVPLAMRGPDIDPGVRRGLATTRSVPATVLGAFGERDEALRAERFGRSLLRRRAQGAPPSEHFVIVETSRAASGSVHSGAMAVVVDEHFNKLVLGLHDRIPQLFELTSDPDERSDLAARRPDMLQSALADFARAEDLGGIRAQPTRHRYFEVKGR